MPRGLSTAEQVRYAQAWRAARSAQVREAQEQFQALCRELEAQGLSRREASSRAFDLHDSIMKRPVPSPPPSVYRDEFFADVAASGAAP